MARKYYREGDEPAPGYKLVEYLGRGGFGSVWKAKGPGGIEVALKIIEDLGRKKGGKELRALRLLKGIRHPNLIPITAYWIKDAEGNLLDDGEGTVSGPINVRETEMIRGTISFDEPPPSELEADELLIAMGLGERSLFDRMEECQGQNLPGIPQDELCTYMEDSARAIDLLNTRHNIQHCDIKPQNIMIVSGAAQVADFGLAKAIGDLRESSMAAGTIAYGAPEVFLGPGPSSATDQYSLAISYYELRTGTLPFSAENISAVLDAKQNGNLDLSLLPEPERAVIARAAAVRPEERYESCTKMARALRRVCPEDEVTPPTPGGQIRATQRRRREGESHSSVSGLHEVVPGYRLAQLLHRADGAEIWEATAPGKKRVALVLQDLQGAAHGFDEDALTAIINQRHKHLSQPHAFWLLNAEGQVIPEESLHAAGGAAKLVIAGPLAPNSVRRRFEQCTEEGQPGIPLPELLYYMRQVADGLDFLNRKQHTADGATFGIQHCYVRPINLLLDRGVVTIGNYTRATSMLEDSRKTPERPQGWSHPWLAPEARRGELTERSDQFSLAVTYLELRDGREPAEGEVDASGLPEEECQVVRRAAAIDPFGRFSSCSEFVEALIAAAGVEPAAPEIEDPPLTGSASIPSGSSQARTPFSMGSMPANAGTMILPARGSKTEVVPHDMVGTVTMADRDTNPAVAEPESQAKSARKAPEPAPSRRRERRAARRERSERKSMWPAIITLAVLVAGYFGAALWASMQHRKQIDSLVEKKEYAEALRQAGQPGVWYAWLTNEEAAREEVRSAWSQAAQKRFVEGDLDGAENENEAFLAVFEGDQDALKLRKRIEDARRPTTSDPQLVLEAAAARLKAAHEALATDPPLALAKADEAVSLLGKLKGLSDLAGDVAQQAAEYRRQAVLLRAWSGARHETPDWRQVDLDLLKLKDLNRSQNGDDSDRRALRTGLHVLAAHGSSVVEKDHDRLIDLHVAHEKAKAAATTNPLWSLSDAEAQQIAQQRAALEKSLRDALVKLLPRPDQALAVADQLLRLAPNDIETLRRKVDLLVRLNRLTDARTAAETAADLATGQDKADLIQRGEAIAAVEDLSKASPKAPPEMLAAILERAAKLRDAMDETLLLAYGEAALTLAGGNKEIRAAALQGFDRVATYLPDSTEKRRLAEKASQIRSSTIPEYRKQVIAAISGSEKPNWDELLKLCQQAEDNKQLDGLVLLARAEAIVGKHGIDVPADQWQQARRAAFDDKQQVDDRFAPYRDYVQALVKYTDPAGLESNRVASADLMFKAFSPEQLPDPLRSPHRHQTGSRLLAAVANSLRQEPGDSSFGELLESPYGSAAEATRAYNWLVKAEDLARATATDDGVRENMLLAALHMERRNKPLATPLAEQLYKKLQNRAVRRDDAPLIAAYIQTRPDDKAGRLAALGAYEELLKLARQENKRPGGEAPPVEVTYEQILKPALDLVKQLPSPSDLDAASRQLIGRLFAAKGRLIRYNEYESWPFKDTFQEVFNSYDSAIKFDDSQADYYIGRGLARRRLPDLDLDAFRADAEAAIKRDADNPGGYSIRADATIQASFKLADLRLRAPMLESAVADCTKAIALSKSNTKKTGSKDEELAVYYINRSNAHLLWANFSLDPTLQKFTTLLEKARADAEEATKLDSRYKHLAYRALGNAWEDLAWIGQKTPQYQDAIKAFKAAIDTRSDDATAWMDLGRCYYKAVHYGRYPQENLKLAKQNLTRAIELDLDRTKAEPHYWLGLVEKDLGDEAAARASFERALKVKKDYHPAAQGLARVYKDEAKYAQADPWYQKAVELAEGAKSVQRQNYLAEWAQTIVRGLPGIDERTPALKKFADTLGGDRSAEGSFFRGRVAEVSGEFDKALYAYTVGIDAPDPVYPDIKPLLYIARSRARAATEERAADLAKATTGASQILADVEKAAKEANSVVIKADALGWKAEATLAALKQGINDSGNKLRSQALSDLRTAVNNAPTHGRAWYWRTLAVNTQYYLDPGYFRVKKNKDDALDELDKALKAAPDARSKAVVGQMRSRIASIPAG